MSYRLTVEPDFVRLHLYDEFTRADIAGLLAELEALELTLDPTPNRLTDATDVSMRQVTSDDFFALAERRRQAVLKNRVKSALIAIRPVNVGFSRMFQTLNDHPQIEIRIFETEDVAAAWLRIP